MGVVPREGSGQRGYFSEGDGDMRMSLRGSLCARHGGGTGVPMCPRLQGGSGDSLWQMSFKNYHSPANCSPQLKKNNSFHSEFKKQEIT